MLTRLLAAGAIVPPNPTMLEGTLLGTRVALLGISTEGLIVVRQLADVAVRALPSAPLALPLKNYFEAHPYASRFTPQLSVGEANLTFEWRDVPARWKDEDQVVTQWALVGLDPDELPDVAVSSPAEGGSGVFALGASAEATEALALAEGRLWLKWEASPTTVGQASQLPAMFTGSRQEVLRGAVVGQGDLVPDPVNYGPSYVTGQLTTSAALSLSGIWQQSGDYRTYRLRTGRVLEERATDFAEGLLEAKAGPVPAIVGVTSVVRPPAESVLLIHAPERGHDLRVGAIDTSTGEGLPQDMALGPFMADEDGDGLEVTLPKVLRLTSDSHGLKITLRAHVKMTGGHLARAYVSVTSSTGRGVLLDVLHRDASEGGSFITGNGERAAAISDSVRSAVPSAVGGVLSMGLEGQRYEVYAYPDRRAEVHVNGELVRVITLPEGALRLESDLSIKLGIYRGSLYLPELVVEDFRLPEDYVPQASLPSIEMIAAWGDGSLTQEQLHGDDSGAAVITLTQDRGTLDFTLTERCLVELDATLWRPERFVAGGELLRVSDFSVNRFVIYRTDGDQTLLNFYGFSGKYIIPRELEAGRYRIELMRQVMRPSTFADNVTIPQELAIRSLRAFPISGSVAHIPAVAGPQELLKGDSNFGFFGEVSPDEFISSNELGRSAHITEMTYLSDVTWLKIASLGKVLFVAKTPAGYDVSLTHLAERGVRFGNSNAGKVTINGRWYRVRLLHQREPEEVNPEYLSFMQALTDGEWARYTPQQLGLDSDQAGHTTLTNSFYKRSGTSVFYYVGMGTDRVGYVSQDGTGASLGWRPVLELLT